MDYKLFKKLSWTIAPKKKLLSYSTDLFNQAKTDNNLIDKKSVNP